MASVDVISGVKENCTIWYEASQKTTNYRFNYYFCPNTGYTFSNSIPYLEITYNDIYGGENKEKVYATKKENYKYQGKVCEYALEGFIWDNYENEKSLDWDLSTVRYQAFGYAKTGEPEPKPPEPKTPVLNYDVGNLSGCNLSYNPNNSDIGVSHIFTLNANSGYVFNATTPTLKIFYNDSVGVENELTEYFVKVSDTQYTLDYLFSVSDWDNGIVTFIFYGSAIVSTITKSTYGTAQLYLLSDDNLSEFARKRDFTNNDTDIGKFVISLNKVFITLPETELTETTLKLGNNDTMINCNTVNSISVKLDCGAVVVPNITNIDVNIQLYLPFSGVQDLTNYKNEISGKNVKLYYETVISNGQTIAVLECENLRLIYELVIAYEIPYFINTFNNADISTTYSINAKFLGSKLPYIYIIPNKPQNFTISGVRDNNIEDIKTKLLEGVIL